MEQDGLIPQHPEFRIPKSDELEEILLRASLRIHYDPEADDLVVRWAPPEAVAITVPFDEPDWLGLLVDADAGEVIGFHIFDVSTYALVEQPELLGILALFLPKDAFNAVLQELHHRLNRRERAHLAAQFLARVAR